MSLRSIFTLGYDRYATSGADNGPAPFAYFERQPSGGDYGLTLEPVYIL